MRRLKNFVQAILLTLVVGVVAIDSRETHNRMADGQPVKHRDGLSPITIDPNANLTYYSSINNTSVWPIKITDLLNASLSDTQLGKRVKRYGERQQ